MKATRFIVAALALASAPGAVAGNVSLGAGQTEAVIAPKASKVAKFAAKELTAILSEAFGEQVPVVTSPTEGRRHVFLGASEWSAAAGVSTNALVRDEFVIKASGDNVYIVGRDSQSNDPEWVLKHGGKGSMLYEKATVFGVYEFLERYAGVRFYFPGELGTIVPKRKSLAVPEGAFSVKPDFTSRYLMAWKGEYFEPDPDYAKKTLNYIRLRFETESVPCCHGSIRFGYLKRFGKTHPEYFALLSNGERSVNPEAPHPGQLCWSSGITEEMYQDAKSYLIGEGPEVRGIPPFFKSRDKYAWGANCSGRKYVDIMPQDSFAKCRCEKCQAAFKTDRHYATELVWGVVDRLARRLTDEGVKGTFTMMAYGPYGRVPEFDLAPNIEVMVARHGPWSMRNPAKLEADNADIVAWAKKLGHKVWLWNYPNKWGELVTKTAGIPQMTPRAYAAYYKMLAPWIRGAFAESETDRYFYNYLNYYVFSKVCWNNAVDVEALLSEHFDLMFGAAAKEMAEIYGALEDRWMSGVQGATVDTPLGPVTKLPPDSELWGKVYSPEFLAQFDGLLSAAAGKVRPGSLEARRIALVRKEFYDPLVEASSRYRAIVEGVRNLSLPADGRTRAELVPLAARGKAGETVKAFATAAIEGGALKVVFECEEPQMANRAATDHEPDDPQLWQDDCVELVLNPSGDLKTYYHFIMNSEGAWSDAKASVGLKADHSWQSGMKSRVSRGEASWRAELEIPLSAFPEVADAFPIEFARERSLKTGGGYQRLYHWSPYARGFHHLENFGKLKKLLPRGVSWAEPAPGLDYGRIYYYVPEGLDLSKRPGLFIFMHGGGAETNSQPETYLKPDGKALRPQVDRIGCITVAATAPHARGDHWRWNHPDAEREILAIIEDVDRKVGIDRDRIILGGQSMGGFGAYHLGQVLADRLAGVWAAAGAWNTADFRSMRGTPMFVQHGVFDCAPGFSNEPVPRAQFKTGYSFALAAHEVMERDGVEHVFSPYHGGHGLKWPEARKSMDRFAEWAVGLRRQPYAAAATVVTPCGSEKPCLVRKTRSRWLEVTETVPGTVDLDSVELSDYEPAETWETYEAQTYRVVKKRLVGFRLQAFNRGGNRFEVVPENVTGFRIHLAAPMGDLSRPFEVDAGPLGRRTLKAIPEAGDGDYCAYLDFAAADRPQAQPKATVVRPKPTDEVLDNPGMGIVVYRHDGSLNAYEPLLAPGYTFDWLPGASVVCLRLPWNVVVPESGDSRWDLVDTYVRAWVAKGRRFALGFTGGTPSDRFFSELSARYSGDGALAFVQVDAAEDREKWQKRLVGVPIKTMDGEQPVLHVPEACRNADLSLNWNKDETLAEVERFRASYYGVSGFPEVSHRNNEICFLAVARRIGYRFELREIEFPDVIASGAPVRIASEWVNVGVANCPNPAYVAYSLLDDNGRVAWQWTDASFDMRALEPSLEGRERPAKVESVCRFGHDCPPPAPGDADAARAAARFYLDGSRPVPMLKPGVYRLAVSVGRADGRPEIALPLEGGAERVYPVGRVTVE